MSLPFLCSLEECLFRRNVGEQDFRELTRAQKTGQAPAARRLWVAMAAAKKQQSGQMAGRKLQEASPAVQPHAAGSRTDAHSTQSVGNCSGSGQALTSF